MKKYCVVRITLLLLLVSVLVAQGQADPGTVSEEPGVCAGAICGPSGGFTVESWPTINAIDWAAFPANPLRPHDPAPGGTRWHVAPGGDDGATGSADAPLATIDRALELAQTGDVISVADGVYPVGLREDSLRLTTPGVTLMAEHIGGVTLEPVSADWAWLAGIEATADDLVIDGFVIRGFSSGVYFGRLESPQRNLVLRHLWIEHSEDALRSVIHDDLSRSQPVIDGLLIYDVAIRDALIGFNCGEGPCDNARLEALDIDLTTSADVDTGSWGDAVAVESGDNNVVFNAHLTGAGADGLDFKSSHVAIANVIVHDVARNGIKLWHDGDVANALVYRTGADAAIVFDGGGAYRLSHCTIARHAVGQSAYAMTVAYDRPWEAGDLDLVNTIFYQNSGAVWIPDSFALNIQATLFYGAANGQELIVGEHFMIGESGSPFWVLENAGLAPAGFDFVDPGFVDPNGGDFTLRPDAFARDRGVLADDLPSFDLYGHPRQSGPGVDLGPIEMGE